MPKKLKYCWDTSVFIAWIKNEIDAPLGDMCLVVDEIDNSDAVLYLAVTTVTEVLEAHFTLQEQNEIANFYKRSNVIVANTTIQIAQKASSIRNEALNDGRKLKTPDAQIVATAFCYKVDVLHSLDPHILNLHGMPYVKGLMIKRPASIKGDQWLNGLPPSE